MASFKSHALGACVAAASVVGLALNAATAQDFTQDPSFGVLNLAEGFLPDPSDVELVAGGTIDATSVQSGCVGMIAPAPDVRLFWDGTSSLIISVDSDDDTTLVVNGPDGSWHCDDDSGEGNNPSLQFRTSLSGQYDIWIGTFGSDYASATLSVSEYASH